MSAETQGRLVGNPLVRPFAHYLLATAVSP